MGSCCSKKKKVTSSATDVVGENRSTPIIEEETVKEVLSDTTSAKTKHSENEKKLGFISYKSAEMGKKLGVSSVENEEVEKKLRVACVKNEEIKERLRFLPVTNGETEKKSEFAPVKDEGNEKKLGSDPCQSEEISDISDLCSMSESFSTSTAAEKKYEDNEENSRDECESRRRNVRSSRTCSDHHELHGKRRRNIGSSSPSRRFPQSPTQKLENGEKSRARSHGTNNVPTDSSEISHRKTRSPTPRTNPSSAQQRPCMSRNSSTGKNVRSQFPADIFGDSEEKPEEPKNEPLIPGKDPVQNSDVSLECFIFL